MEYGKYTFGSDDHYVAETADVLRKRRKIADTSSEEGKGYTYVIPEAQGYKTLPSPRSLLSSLVMARRGMNIPADQEVGRTIPMGSRILLPKPTHMRACFSCGDGVRIEA